MAKKEAKKAPAKKPAEASEPKPDKPKTQPEVEEGESKEEKLRRYVESTEPEHKWDAVYEAMLSKLWPEKYEKKAKG